VSPISIQVRAPRDRLHLVSAHFLLLPQYITPVPLFQFATDSSACHNFQFLSSNLPSMYVLAVHSYVAVGLGCPIALGGLSLFASRFSHVIFMQFPNPTKESPGYCRHQHLSNSQTASHKRQTRTTKKDSVLHWLVCCATSSGLRTSK
jgi:hypothetical protein